MNDLDENVVAVAAAVDCFDLYELVEELAAAAAVAAVTVSTATAAAAVVDSALAAASARGPMVTVNSMRTRSSMSRRGLSEAAPPPPHLQCSADGSPLSLTLEVEELRVELTMV